MTTKANIGAKMRAADARLYRKAAALIGREQHCPWLGWDFITYGCEALWHADGCSAKRFSWDSLPAGKRMREFFDDGTGIDGWLGIKGLYSDHPEQLEVRRLALCFMAAMVEAGDA